MEVDKNAFDKFIDELNERNERRKDEHSHIEAHKELTDEFAACVKNFYHSFREQGFNDEQSVLFITSMLHGYFGSMMQ